MNTTIVKQTEPKIYKPLKVRIAPILAKAITKKRVESGTPVTFKRK